jgi:phosphate transport system substrate-binding protein
MVALGSRNPDVFRTYCQRIREDGVYVESGENDNLIVQKLQKDTTAVGIFGFNFYAQNYDRVQAAEINGVAPTWETIFEHSYPLARPLYVYVKTAHIGWIPGLQAFLLELTDERAWGEDGYLADHGLIPLPRAERELYASKVRALRRQVE